VTAGSQSPAACYGGCCVYSMSPPLPPFAHRYDQATSDRQQPTSPPHLVRCHLCSFLVTPPPPPDRGAEYCDKRVCLYVFRCVCVCMSVCDHIFGTIHVRPSPIFVHVTDDRGSALLVRRSDTLCTSGFMDNVTFVFAADRRAAVDMDRKAAAPAADATCSDVGTDRRTGGRTDGQTDGHRTVT